MGLGKGAIRARSDRVTVLGSRTSRWDPYAEELIEMSLIARSSIRRLVAPHVEGANIPQ
jgi:hypothetical protein